MTHEPPPLSFRQRIRALPRAVENAPPVALLVVGLVVTVLGLLIVTRPLTSLVLLGIYIGVSCLVSGIGDLVVRPRSDRWQFAFAVLWIVAGVAVLVWIGRSIEVLPVFLAVLLVVAGVGRLSGLVRGTSGQRAIAAAFGLAEIAFGVLALAWPDATLIVVAVLFGVRTVVFGASLLWRAGRDLVARDDDGGPAPRSRPVRHRRVVTALQWTAAVAVLAMTAGTLLVSHTLRSGAPVVDRFYSAPATIPAEPGTLLRSEPYTTELPAGVSAWRILYTTTTKDGDPALASGVVAVPESTGTDPRPVIAWDHGTNGIARGCAPSLTSNAISSAAIPALEAVVRNGWAIVATDYTGEGAHGPFPYLVGETEARSTLDAVRAAHQLPKVSLSAQTIVWGHSQGGHAALWTAQIAPTYAPELDVLGTAALAPASDPAALAADITSRGSAGPIAIVTSYLLASYARSYDDIQLKDYVATPARRLVEEMADRCATEPGSLASVLNSLAIADDQPLFRLDLSTGRMAARLAENKPTGPFTQPLFIGQGESDEVISPAIQDDYVAALCAAGQPLEYMTYPDKSHMGVVATDSPLNADLEQWTRDRLDGRPAEDTCPN